MNLSRNLSIISIILIVALGKNTALFVKDTAKEESVNVRYDADTDEIEEYRYFYEIKDTGEFSGAPSYNTNSDLKEGKPSANVKYNIDTGEEEHYENTVNLSDKTEDAYTPSYKPEHLEWAEFNE